MFKISLLIYLFIAGNRTNSQKDEFRVVAPEISGTYQVNCNQGPGLEKGVVQGIDEGQFDMGLPGGKGTYRQANMVY